MVKIDCQPFNTTLNFGKWGPIIFYQGLRHFQSYNVKCIKNPLDLDGHYSLVIHTYTHRIVLGLVNKNKKQKQQKIYASKTIYAHLPYCEINVCHQRAWYMYCIILFVATVAPPFLVHKALRLIIKCVLSTAYLVKWNLNSKYFFKEIPTHFFDKSRQHQEYT